MAMCDISRKWRTWLQSYSLRLPVRSLGDFYGFDSHLIQRYPLPLTLRGLFFVQTIFFRSVKDLSHFSRRFRTLL